MRNLYPNIHLRNLKILTDGASSQGRESRNIPAYSS
jgi:hypothetical protein